MIYRVTLALDVEASDTQAAEARASEIARTAGAEIVSIEDENWEEEAK